MEQLQQPTTITPTVFLGGTCNNSTWRDGLMTRLVNALPYNPVVADWTPECQAEEIRQREISDYCLYVITPKMQGVYSIAEVIDDSNKRPAKTLFAYLLEDEAEKFTPSQTKSLAQVGKMVEGNGGRWFKSLDEVVNFLNSLAAAEAAGYRRQINLPAKTDFADGQNEFQHEREIIVQGQPVTVPYNTNETMHTIAERAWKAQRYDTQPGVTENTLYNDWVMKTDAGMSIDWNAVAYQVGFSDYRTISIMPRASVTQ